MHIKKNTIIVLFVLFGVFLLEAENVLPSGTFAHYSDQDGLTQSSVNGILQDKKGFLWLGTFNGLYRFDGYEFKHYKVSSTNSFIARSNRVDYILEDKYGRLWLKSPNDFYSFNTFYESFWSLKSVEKLKDVPLYTNDIYVAPSGKVWLLNDGLGCVCVKDSLNNIETYSITNEKLKSNTVNEVYEDSNGNTWLLTNNGLVLISAQEHKPLEYILNRSTANHEQYKRFLSAYESDNEIWFGSDKGKIWRYTKNAKTFVEVSLPVKADIRYIVALDQNRLIFLTRNNGFYVYDIVLDEFTEYSTSTLPALKSNKVEHIYSYQKTQIWFTTEEIGIYKLELKTNKLKQFIVPVDDNTVYTSAPSPIVLIDKHHGLWVHPRGGGFSYYNKEKDELQPFFNKADDANKLFSNILHSAWFDRQDNLWFSTRSHGLEKFTFVDNKVNVHTPIHPETSSLSNNIRTIHQRKNGQIIIATKEGRVMLFSAALKPLGCISVKGEIGKDFLWPSAVYCIAEDENNMLWFGTRGNGIFTLKSKANHNTFMVENFVADDNNPFSISNNDIYDIWQDANSNMWFASLGGGINLLLKSSSNEKQFIHVTNQLKSYPIQTCARVRRIMEGPNNKMYAGTSGGLLVWNTDFNQPEDIQFQHYSRSSLPKNNLNNNEIMDIELNEAGDIFLATYGGGLNKVLFNDSKEISGFQSYTKNHGLPEDVLLSMVTDQQGNIWLTTENDLVRFYPASETFESFPQAKQLMQGNIFSEACSYQLNNNKLLVGFLNGYLSFHPDSLPANSFSPNITLSNFQLFNTPTLNNENAPFKGSVDDVDEVALKHDQNFFSIEFTALDFVNTEQILYAHKLEGFDNEWKYTKKQRFANYTNIPKGKYIFKVKSTNGFGTWVDNERILPITIHPSFWQTPLAYALYIILFVVLFILLQRNILFIYRLKSDIKVQKQVSDMKAKFFTDISHEIRTPLTMITAPIEYLINDNETPKDIKKQLSFISQNTKRLLKLVNQILDFRKIQSQKLRITEINLGQFAEKVCIDFMEMAEENGLNLSFTVVSADVKIWADQNALEKVIINLLSNAFKFCASGDQIKVVVHQQNNSAILKVSDTGPGISKAKQKQLFKRFASFSEDSSKPSTGIGLSIVKEVADLHSAELSVESEVGQGSTFLVTFPLGNTHFKENVEIVYPDNKSDINVKENIQKTEDSALVNKDSVRPTILVVEDDKELRQFIETILASDYIIVLAEDGEEGLEKAKQESPDFIISDIMMPKKDGIELLKDLRNDSDTSHIPIILLTAKTHIESKLEGLSYGADDYITKPFSVSYLKARIQNLMEQRKRLQAVYRNILSNGEMEQPKPNLIAPADEQFMENVLGFIQKNMDNNEFSVEELARLTGLSRTSFYNKIRSLTGMSPVEFVRDYRISKAAQLITSEQLLVKEICYMVGFSDLKYFGKCFKTKYGMSPVKYRNFHQQ